MASQVIIACGTNIAPAPPTYQIPGDQVLNFDYNAFMQEIGTRTLYVMDHHGNWMADAPAELYLNMPPDMAANFSTGMGAEPKKILKDLLPAGRKLVRWSVDDMWERARILRARWPDAVNDMFKKPQAWADLFEYYDSEDLYFLGALNVWNLVNLIVEINWAMTERERQSKLFIVQNWVEDWMTWEGNRMMLECWEPTQSQNILVILSDYDRKEGGCGDFQHYEDEQLLKLTLEKRYAEWINTGSHGNYVQSWLDSTDSRGKTTSPPPLEIIPEDGVPLRKARVFGRVVSAPVSGLRWDMTESVSAPRSSSAQLTGVTNEDVANDDVTNEDVTNEDETEHPLGDITSQALNVEIKPETKTEFEQGIKAFISASAPASPALTQESSMDSNKENCPPSAPATVPSAEGLTINVLADVDNVAGQPRAVNTITQPEMAGLYIRQTQDHSTAINTRNSVPPTAQPGTNSMQQDWSQFSGGFASYMKQPPAPNDTGPRGYSYAGRASNTTTGGPPLHSDLQQGATNLQNQPVTQYATVENARGFAGVPPPQVQSARTASGFTDRSLSFGQPQGKSPPRSAGWQPKYYDVLHGRVYTREGGGTSGAAASSQSSYRHTTPPRGNTGRSVSERPSPPGCANAGRRGILTSYVACYCKRCGPRQRAVFVSKLSDALDLKHPRVQANIRDYFSEFGQVDRIEAHEMKQNVFVFFKTEAGAHAAINRGHRHPIKGLSDDALCVNYPVFSQFFRPRYLYQGHVPNYHSTKNTDKYRPQRPSQQDRSQKYYHPPAPAQYNAYHEPAPTSYEKRWPSNSQSRHTSPSRAQVRQFQQPGYELPLGKTRQGQPPAAGPAGDARAATYSYPGVGGYSAGCAPQDSQPYYPPYQAGLSNMGMPPPNAFRQPDVQPPAMVPPMTGPYMPGEQPVYYPPPAENYVPNTNFDYPAPQLAQPVIKFPPKEDMGAFGARANRRKSDSAMTTPTKASKGKKKSKKPARAGRALSDQQDSGSAKDSAEESMMGTVIRRKPVPKASILPSAAVTSAEDSMEENSMRTVIRRKPVPKPSILPSASAAAATSAENYAEEINTGTVIRRKPVPRPRILPSAAAATAAEESMEENDTGTVIRRKAKIKPSILPEATTQGDSSDDAESTRLTSLPKGFDPFPRMSSHCKLPSTSGAPATVNIASPPPKGKAPATPPNKAPAVAPTPSPEQKIVVNEATPPQAIKANPPAEYRTPSPAAAQVVRRAASDPDVAATRASSSKRPALTQSTLQALGKIAKATPMNLTSPTKQDATKLVVSTPSEAKSRETSYETAKTHLSPESSPGEGSDRSAAAWGKGKQKQKLQPAGSGSPARQARPFPSRPSTPTATTTGTQTAVPMQGNNDNGSSSMASPTKTSPSRAAVKKWKSPAKDAGPNAGPSKAPNERPAKSWARYTSKASAPAFNMSNFPALPVNKTRDASDATQAARVRAWAEKRKMKEEVLSPTEASASGSDKE